MIKLLEKLLNLIYIQPCYFCHSTRDDNIICKRCYNRIHFMPLSTFRDNHNCKIYACTLYDEITKKLIRDLKYHNKKQLAPLQAKIMYEYWLELNKKENFLIIPVPIHQHRKKERKYNHMDLVADELSKLTGYKNNKKFIIRTKDTKKQFNLNKTQRIQNIRNAFEINPNEIINKEENLLIIDDITSTGITLEEIIKLLRKNGYKNITALTLATPDIWN